MLSNSVKADFDESSKHLLDKRIKVSVSSPRQKMPQTCCETREERKAVNTYSLLSKICFFKQFFYSFRASFWNTPKPPMRWGALRIFSWLRIILSKVHLFIITTAQNSILLKDTTHCIKIQPTVWRSRLTVSFLKVLFLLTAKTSFCQSCDRLTANFSLSK